ncbi:MAG: glycosyltransferase family 4 protein [Candidatus Poribacteria bacterium]|nr:glycosyltransferase family 4 protein [Candidatus Poribacteria bacterium]
MVIASLYPLVEGGDESICLFDWEFIRALQRGTGGDTHDIYVFSSQGCHPPYPLSVERNVHIKNTMELSDFFQESQVNVWHDFGYTPAFHLADLRHLSGQNFPITMKVEPSFLAKVPLTVYSGLSDNDAIICSRASIQELVEAAHGQYTSLTTPQSQAQVYTIPHGYAASRINGCNKRDARYLLHLPEGMTLILCSGDFSPDNSMDLLPLIRAFQTITESHENVLLIISGPDEYGYADRISEYLKGSPLQRRILLQPNISESARLLLLAASDIFISPSDTVYRDNQPQVLEAMARGIPVIAPDDGEPHYIHHGRTGFRLNRECLPYSYNALSGYFPFIPHHVQSLIVSQGIAVNVQQMVEYLTLLVEDASLRETLGTAAAQYVSDHHSLETIVAKYENLWRDLSAREASVPSQKPVVENQGGGSWLPLLLSQMFQTIDERTPIQITSDGETLLETQNLVIYKEMSEVLFPSVILEILNLSRTVTSLSDITHSLLHLSDTEDVKNLVPNIAYHTMWCIKQGLIALKQNDSVSI